MDEDNQQAGRRSVQRVVSACQVAADKRWERWCEAVRRQWPLDLEPVERNSFQAELTVSVIGDLRLTEMRCAGHSWELASRAASGASCDVLFFYFIQSGVFLAEQDGKRTRLGAGAGAYFIRQPPRRGSCPGGIHMWVLEVPCSAMQARVSGLEQGAGADLSQNSLLFPLVRRYVAELGDCGPDLTACLGRRIASNLTDLVSAMVAEAFDGSALALSEYRTASLQRVLDYIENSLSDPDLSAATVSEALHLSPRYINRLLEAKGTSLGRLIQRRRLESVAADLEAPSLSARSVSTIAMAHGFNNLSHFGKIFRQRYGISPNGYRKVSRAQTKPLSIHPDNSVCWAKPGDEL